MLTFIILDYRSASNTVSYIHHLCEKIKLVEEPISFVVVDNSVQKSNFQILSKAFPTIEKTIWNGSTLEKKEVDNKVLYLWENIKNVGYAQGNNAGAKIALDFLKGDYLLFSNNDLLVLDQELNLDVLIQEHKNKRVGAVGPSIIGKNGEFQNPYFEKSFFLRWCLEYLVYPFGRFLPKKWGSGDLLQPFHTNPVFRVMGSFFIMPSKIFWKIGGMDPNTFLFAEELILAKRLEKAGFVAHYVDSVHLLHNHSASINLVYNKTQRLLQQFRSELYYYQNYCGVSRLSAFIAKIILYSYITRKKIVRFVFNKTR